MLFLSRLVVDPRSWAVRRDLMDCQALHRTTMSAFPSSTISTTARATFSVLHRVDTTPDGKAIVLVQSTVQPDWSRLPDGYVLAITTGDNPACRRIDETLRAIPSGAKLTFRLRANPTRKVDTKTQPDGQRRNGRRVELGGEGERLSWLTRKAQEGGFRVLSVRDAPTVLDTRVTAEAHAGGRRSTGSAGRQQADRHLTLGSVLFEGHLVVEDPERFYETIEKGIGSGKAYGFGLLSLARSR